MTKMFVFATKSVEIQNDGFFQQKSYVFVYFTIYAKKVGVERLKLINS